MQNALDCTFFTADEHYDHQRVITFCNRPFPDVAEMREAIIARHNAKVPKGGITYHLGDMFWRTLSGSQAADILGRLNGQHYFVWGNHDEVIHEYQYVRDRFIWCKDIAVIEPRGLPKITLCHYAMRTWPLSYRGAWQLYGHSHGALYEGGLSFDVGVDANKYSPVSLREVAQRMSIKIANGEHNADRVQAGKEWNK